MQTHLGSFGDAQRYKALVGLVLLDPRDMCLQRALLHARRRGVDLPYR